GIVRPTRIHSQTERGDFTGAIECRKLFAGFERSLAFFDQLAVHLRVGPIARPHTQNAGLGFVPGGAWTERVIKAAAPVVDVVAAGATWKLGGRTRMFGKIRDFVLAKTRAVGA